MKEETKIFWLKRILLAKVIITFFVWGLPALFGTEWFLGLFNLSMPKDPMYLRLFGAAVTAFGTAYWFAYRDPLTNRSIIQAGIVDNLLITLVIIYLSFTNGIESWFIYVSGILTGLFCISFMFFLPKPIME